MVANRVHLGEDCLIFSDAHPIPHFLNHSKPKMDVSVYLRLNSEKHG